VETIQSGRWWLAVTFSNPVLPQPRWRILALTKMETECRSIQPSFRNPGKVPCAQSLPSTPTHPASGRFCCASRHPSAATFLMCLLHVTSEDTNPRVNTRGQASPSKEMCAYLMHAILQRDQPGLQPVPSQQCPPLRTTNASPGRTRDGSCVCIGSQHRRRVAIDRQARCTGAGTPTPTVDACSVRFYLGRAGRV
jgi:hypothetical protein